MCNSQSLIKINVANFMENVVYYFEWFYIMRGRVKYDIHDIDRRFLWTTLYES